MVSFLGLQHEQLFFVLWRSPRACQGDDFSFGDTPTRLFHPPAQARSAVNRRAASGNASFVRRVSGSISHGRDLGTFLPAAIFSLLALGGRGSSGFFRHRSHPELELEVLLHHGAASTPIDLAFKMVF